MPAIQSVTPPFTCAHAGELESYLAVMQTRGVLTRNQAVCARIAAIHSLPCTLELRQRTRKSVTYLYINGAHAATISHRARLTPVSK